jgi:hypothetical protein
VRWTIIDNLLGILKILIMFAVSISISVAIFAAPGFLVLAIAGYDNIGFWNSAAAGFGTIIILGLILGGRS